MPFKYGSIGDSGGPLLQLHERRGRFEDGDPSRDVLSGIASFGDDTKSTGDVSKAEVYTSVGFFRDWINCVIEGNISRVSGLVVLLLSRHQTVQTCIERVLMCIHVQAECFTKPIPDTPSSEISPASEPPTSEISSVPEAPFSEISPAPELPTSEISPASEAAVYLTDPEESVSAPGVEVDNCFELLGDDFEEKDAQKVGTISGTR